MEATLIGDRIRAAREAIDLGQDALAEKVGLGRTALSAVENGKRAVSAAELLRFSDLLGRPLDYFLRHSPPAFDFQPLLRVGGVGSAAAEPKRGRPPRGDGRSVIRGVLVRFEELCRMYLESEEISGLPVEPLPQFAFEPGRFMYREAERLADLMRTRLGLGPALPAAQLRELLEERLAIKTFVQRANTKLSGACIYHERVGGCVLVIAKTLPHMLYTLAHELAHLLAHRDTPVVDEDLFAKTPKEQFANAFAANLLMPRAGAQELFAAVYQSRADLSEVEVIHMARHFGVSFSAMLWRLQGLRLIPPQTREKIEAAYKTSGSGGPVRDIANDPKGKWWKPLPERYIFLALRAYHREEISIGRLAELLHDADGHPSTIERAQEFVEHYQTPTRDETESSEMGALGEDQDA